MIDAREKARQDAMAREAYVWLEGKAEGKAEIISAMKKNGKSVEEIAEFIGMLKEEVAQFLTKSYEVS